MRNQKSIRRGSTLLSLKNRKLKWDLTADFNYIMRGYREDRARLPLEPHGDRVGGSGQKLPHVKSQLDCKKPFHCKGGQTPELGTAEVLLCPSLQGFKTHLGKSMTNLI